MSKCIKCGRYTNQLFCDYCNQEIQKEINKTNFYNFHKKFDNQKIYKCDNGIYVRSQGERTIADFLYKNNIPFDYEVKCKYGEYNIDTKETVGKFMVPDFYIKGPISFNGIILENLFIEFWGRKDKKYLETKENKIRVYKVYNYTLINVYPNDIYDYKTTLTYKLTHFIQQSINY